MSFGGSTRARFRSKTSAATASAVRISVSKMLLCGGNNRPISRCHLVSHRQGSFDEHFVSYELCVGGINRKADRWIYIEVVRLPGKKSFTLRMHWSELHAGCVNGLAAGPLVCLFGCALGTFGSI